MQIFSQRQLLEKALARNHSNYTELAKQLGVTRQAMSQFKYDAPMSTELALKLAEQLPDLNPDFVVICIEHNKAQRLGRDEAVKIWERLAKLASKAK